MSDETTLLPCPWCGNYPKLAEDGGSTGPWFCVWHDCPPVEGGKARHYGESLGCISITTAWFHTEAEAIAAWNNRTHGTLTAEQVSKAVEGHGNIMDNRLYEDWQAVADELNAELVSGTCENVWAEFGKFKCSECAMEVNAISTNTTTPRSIAFCPNCGKAVSR